MEQRGSFLALELANRRRTAELVLAFIVLYALVGFGLDLALHTLRIVGGQLIGSPWLTIAAVVIAAGESAGAYYFGASLVLGSVHADEFTAESAQDQVVLDVINEMALASRIPAPRVYLMDDPSPNAFATGRDRAHSTICVTRGLIDQMDREELQGVIAHEFAHIRDHDTRISMMAAVMVGGLALLPGLVVRKHVGRHDLGEADGWKAGPLAALGPFALPILVLGGLAWLFSKLVAIALAREREYLADASSVEFTRNPRALIRALEHIAKIERPLKRASLGVAPLFIVDPFAGGGRSQADFVDEVSRIESEQDKSEEQRDAELADYVAREYPQNRFLDLISTHPPIHDRLARLHRLLSEDSGGAGDKPAESEAEISARRKAAAKDVIEVEKTHPEAMVAALQASLQATPQGREVIHALAGNTLLVPGSGSVGSSDQAKPRETTADQQVYERLYKYNLSCTGDEPPPETALAARSILGGTSSGIEPQSLPYEAARTRAALSMVLASIQASQAAAAKPVAAKPVATKIAIATAPGGHRGHPIAWTVIAISVGVIIATLAAK